MSQLSITVGTAKSIKQLGGDDATVAQAVAQAMTDPCMMSTARAPSSGDVAQLYALAMDDAQLYPVLAEVEAAARL